MANFVVSDDSLSSIASAIRAKGNTSSLLTYPDGFVSAINLISGNAVTGNFKGTTTEMPIDVPIPYDRDGYPTALIIFPSEGAYNHDGTLYNLIQRYSAMYWLGVKNVGYLRPSYEGIDLNDQMSYLMLYKNSVTDPRRYNTVYNFNAFIYQNANALSGYESCVRLKNKALMSVFITSTGYGFAANIDYTYAIMYSA